jgi:hypothetical protein
VKLLDENLLHVSISVADDVEAIAAQFCKLHDVKTKTYLDEHAEKIVAGEIAMKMRHMMKERAQWINGNVQPIVQVLCQLSGVDGFVDFRQSSDIKLAARGSHEVVMRSLNKITGAASRRRDSACSIDLTLVERSPGKSSTGDSAEPLSPVDEMGVRKEGEEDTEEEEKGSSGHPAGSDDLVVATTKAEKGFPPKTKRSLSARLRRIWSGKTRSPG